MSQAVSFCREMQVKGRKHLQDLIRRYKGKKARRGPLSITFPDGSVVKTGDNPHILEASENITTKFWIGTGA